MNRLTFFILFIFITFSVLPQNDNPVDEVIVSSTFGDFRNDHFHTGIDISGKDKIVYSPNDVETVFYSNDRKGSIRYGNGNFVILESKDHKFRYNMSHIKSDTLNKDKDQYKKNEPVCVSGNTGFSSGDHLHYEIEEIPEKRIVNPFKYLNVEDTIKPVIQDVYIIDGDQKTSLLKFNNYNVRKNSRLYIQCYDLINRSRYNVTPYKIRLFLNGEERSSISFEYLNKENNDFAANNSLHFNDIYQNMTNFDYYLTEMNIIPGVIGLRIEIEDYAGNKEIFKRPIKIVL